MFLSVSSFADLCCVISSCTRGVMADGDTLTKMYLLGWRLALTSMSFGLQAVRRILANVPVCCQVLSGSPYLDGNLFQYDDKYISAIVRPRVYGDSILRFVSKQHPESAKFKIAGEPFDIPPTHGRAIKQVIHYHFHPVLPFVMSYLQTFVAGPQICIYTRI